MVFVACGQRQGSRNEEMRAQAILVCGLHPEHGNTAPQITRCGLSAHIGPGSAHKDCKRGPGHLRTTLAVALVA